MLSISRYIFLFLLICSCGSNNEPSEEKAILEVFKEFFTTVKEGNYKKAGYYIDKKTLTFLNGAFNNAIKADSSDMSKLNLIENFAALYFRKLLINNNQFKNLSPIEILLVSISERLQLDNVEENLRLGKINFKQNNATAKLFFNGKAVFFTLKFVKEKNYWKINFWAFKPLLEIELARRILFVSEKENLKFNIMIEEILGTAAPDMLLETPKSDKQLLY